jgi:hemoglobin/transferrin/lactoferrin receptor protein
MDLIKIALIVICSVISLFSFGQKDTAKIKTFSINEVVISANKFEESRKNVPQQMQIILAKEIANSQSQSTADLLEKTGGVFVQKSQLGGGSPVIRGFEASRILIVIDGIKMNNIIYRAGHLQSVVTLDNAILDRMEVLFGPASTIYGSDALGGVIHFYTKKPLLAIGNQNTNLKVNAFTRFGTVANEKTGHIDFNIGFKKFASLTSFTYSQFGDLHGGRNQNPFYTQSYGERPYYVERINGKDSLVKNSDRFLQIQSGYSQYDILQKFLFQQNEHVSHGINVQYSNSSNVPRYDRLTDPKDNGLNYAEWYYGPQTRMLAAYDLNIKNRESFFPLIHFDLSYQSIEESRHSRRFGNNDLAHRIENVNVMGLNLDFQKTIMANKICFGIDAFYNTLKSTANSEDITTGAISKLDTRYPDGENYMADAALFITHTWQINNKFVLIDGIRGGISSLHSNFIDTSFFHLPFNTAEQTQPVYSGSIGLIYTPTKEWKMSLMLSSGFRTPNVDDLAKIFESSPGTIIVPNIDLKPEQTLNTELGITKLFGKNILWENSVYYSKLSNVIVTDKFKFNGADSILYDGTLSQVLANQNKQEAYIYGFSSNIKCQFGEHFIFSLLLNYTYGRIKTDSVDAPLGHIPPFMANLKLSYTNKKFSSDFFVNYNGWKYIKDYQLNGEDNEQYATNKGMPAWFTLNLRASYDLKMFSIQAGVENILDTQYRTFASGINGGGRNFYVALRLHL